MEESIRDTLEKIASFLEFMGKDREAELMWKIIVYLNRHGINVPSDLG